MKRALFFFVLYFLVGIQASRGQIPQTMSYQGELLNASGMLVPDGNYNLTFKLYNVATGGSSLWIEQQPVFVQKGIFNVILGNVNPLVLPFDRPYWLGVTIGTEPEFASRGQLTSSAYSLMARSIADGAVTNSKIADHTIDITKLNFLSFKGDKGDRGEQGLKGDKGDQGLKGDKGDPGPPVSQSVYCVSNYDSNVGCSRFCTGRVIVDGVVALHTCTVTTSDGRSTCSAGYQNPGVGGIYAVCCVCAP